MEEINLNNLKQKYEDIRMSESDFGFIRNRLSKSMDREKAVWGDRFSVFAMFPEKYLVFVRRASVVLLAVIVVGAGASYAAERSLPGDALYSMKLNINEPIVKAFAYSSQEKAEVEVKFAGKRLEEAQKLNAQNRLDVGTSKSIAEKFKSHADAAEKAVDVLVEEGNTIEAIDVLNSLESVVVAHGEVFADATDNQNASSSLEILSETDKETLDLEQKKIETEARLAKAEIIEQERNAQLQKIKAETKYDSVMSAIRFIDPQSEEYNSSLIGPSLEVARLHVDYGQELFIASDFVNAQREFNEAIVIFDSILVKLDLINDLEKLRRIEQKKKEEANIINAINTSTSTASTTESINTEDSATTTENI